MKFCHKFYYPKRQLSVGKSFALFKLHYLHLKQYTKPERVCFGIKVYRVTSSNSITLNFSVNNRKRKFDNGNDNGDKSPPERTPFTN